VIAPAGGRRTRRPITRPLRDIAAIALGDHLIISGRARRLDGFYLEFTSIADGTAQAVARELESLRVGQSVEAPAPRRRRKAAG
jgi:hypothetical protein